ncbi:uncharacterized protein NPIL_462021 [Nephila pilipes]|uniref:Uncharacterized protein n=1 Tax=Nephila pilipes TaxID=299642 RepID=A0A8X6QAN5_NEPPI|nr:uncharacterized protein NPIL_462021 [Nephila pilipes]
MDVYFWPSLQILASARLARGILYTFDTETLNSGKYDMKQVKEKVSAIILPAFASTFTEVASEPQNSNNELNRLSLQIKIQTQLVCIVSELGSEIEKWFRWHENNPLKSRASFDVRNVLSWRSIGIIDRFKTARVLIQNKCLNIKDRLFLACQYYFEDDVQKLWTVMSKKDRLRVRIQWKNSGNMQHWLRALINRTALDWAEMSRNITKDEFFFKNFEGVPYYFARLQGQEIRYLCIQSWLEHGYLCPFDLYFCLFQLKAEELTDVLTRLPKDLMHEVFAYFLQWPLQSVFLGVVKSFKAHINGDIFLALICVLVDKLESGGEDNAYIDLLKNLWNALSSQYSNFVEQHEILNKIVKYVLSATVPFNRENCQNFISKLRVIEGEKTERRKFSDIFYPWNA